MSTAPPNPTAQASVGERPDGAQGAQRSWPSTTRRGRKLSARRPQRSPPTPRASVAGQAPQPSCQARPVRTIAAGGAEALAGGGDAVSGVGRGPTSEHASRSRPRRPKARDIPRFHTIGVTAGDEASGRFVFQPQREGDRVGGMNGASCFGTDESVRI